MTTSTSADAKIMEEAEAFYPEFVRMLGELVNMDSGSEDAGDLRKKRSHISAAMRAIGAEVREVECDAPYNDASVVLASIKGSGKARILFFIHYDTVWTSGEAAVRPFHIEGDKAYGVGILDSQASIPAVIGAAVILKNIGFTNFAELTFLFNPDEEVGSRGAKNIMRAQAGKHDAVFSMEGSLAGTTIAVSTRSTNTATITVKGRPSHSGIAPELGINAGVELAHQMLQMLDLSDKDKGTDANWTIGSFGIKDNVIPEFATASMNIRTTYATDLERVKSAILERIKNKKVAGTEVSVKFHEVMPNLEPNEGTNKLADMFDNIYKAELGETEGLKRLHVRGGTDAAHAYGKAPAIDGLCIGGGGPHTHEEFVNLNTIVPRLYMLVRGIQEFCTGKYLPVGLPER